MNVFNSQTELSGYSRMVPTEEIANSANEYNLNIPRYIDASEPEDVHDLYAHLNGGIPDRDIDALDAYWTVFPTLRRALFGPNGRDGYSEAKVEAGEVRTAILGHDEFVRFQQQSNDIFDAWREEHVPVLKGIKIDLGAQDGYRYTVCRLARSLRGFAFDRSARRLPKAHGLLGRGDAG